MSACSENDAVRRRYQAEKKYSMAAKLESDARIHSGLSASHQQQAIQALYQDALVFCRAALDSMDQTATPVEFAEISSITHRSSTRLSQLLFGGKQYDSCVVLLSDLIQSVPLGRIELISTHINLAQALQASGDWDSAATIYTHAVNSFHPPVVDGQPHLNLLNLPLHLQHVYDRTGDSINARTTFDWAEQYFLSLIEDYPGSSLAMAAHGNLSRLYYDGGQMEASVEQLGFLVDSTGLPALNARLRTADILASGLKRYEEAMGIYDEIGNRLTGRDTVYIPGLILKKARVRFYQDRYADARMILIDLSTKYPGYYNSNPSAQYMKARTFELGGNWERAETEYKFLIEQYTDSREAMGTHLYLARRLGEQGRTTESANWYTRAEQYYDRMATRTAGTSDEARALTYKADMYRQLERWQEAADVLQSIADKFPETRLGHDALLTAAAVYRDRLSDSETADGLVEEFRRTYTPDARAADSSASLEF